VLRVLKKVQEDCVLAATLFPLRRIKGKKMSLTQHSKCVGCFDVYVVDCDHCGCTVTINSVSTGADSGAPYNVNNKADQRMETRGKG
jgi:hypothetical protein